MFRHICTRFKQLNLKNSSCFLFGTCRFSNKPDFTRNHYRVLRGNYNKLEENHLRFFRDLLGENRILTDLSDLEKYNVDWFRNLRGGSNIVLKPKTTQEVSEILSFCNRNLLAVTPQGGNTGVVGAGIPVFDEIIISSELMNRIISLDETSGVLECEAGCVLQTVDEYLAERDLIFPLDLGAKGSCRIGGNVATNAGGLRVLRYGNLHGNVLGLEVVQANGEVLDLLSTLKKDNTGYHMKNIFIGSEGTLGFITKVVVQCASRPKFKNVAFLGLQSYDKVLRTFHKAKQDLGEILSAFEVMDTPSLDLVKEHLNLSSPIGDYPYYVIVETSGSNETHDGEKVGKFLEESFAQNYILNGTVSGEPTRYQAIWDIREKIPEAFAKDGHVLLYDVSLPLKNYYTLVEDMRKRMGKLSHRVFGFGHIGDCNLHLQISVKELTPEIHDHIEPYIFERTKQLNGSISAEHGMGFLKAKYLPLMKSNAAIHAMRMLKRSMDPNGILNPYKVLP